MSEYALVNGELYHHGIKGMKWGVRRFQDKNGDLTPAGRKRYADDVSEKKAAYKQAKKDYNKSFNKAYNRSIAAYSPIKKHRKANDERWEDAADKADRLKKAKADYKNAKTVKKQRQKALEEEYGKLEDQMTYGKKADAKKNAALTKRMNEIESEMKTNKGEKTFNTLKKGANALLDKADRDNFFNSDDIFSEASMKRQSRIDRTRDVINSLDYKTLTKPGSGKQLVDMGKKFIRDSLDDADNRSFFNDDWDTRMSKRDRNDFIRDLIDD